jgi:hypothetical protein
MPHLLALASNPTVQRNVGLFVLYLVLMVAVGRKSQIDAWCYRNPRRAGWLKLVRGILPADPWLIVQGIALVVFGRLPIAYQRAANNVVPYQPADPNGQPLKSP